MPARVKVRAVIWIDERVVVHRAYRRGEPHATLPGGRGGVPTRTATNDGAVQRARNANGPWRKGTTSAPATTSTLLARWDDLKLDRRLATPASVVSARSNDVLDRRGRAEVVGLRQ